MRRTKFQIRMSCTDK